ncbi:hypothetical protein A8990_113121 [Paenibacillus taihuensis]|uniref:Uncharacterized protein n=1 Tax=Paenibacillus taihuensis TaxID=1156355 RepID=A0A3D9S4S3_9BACL|nr:hypothetical protein [Paenibacillus taihuensis]REE85201.1 hypothetical protein A8990_113121 [Paenibacillus taihuensis]
MNNQVKIPNGDEKVTVELTRKELMSLAGIRFYDNHKIEVSARKKLHDLLEAQESAPPQLYN